jgi:drug/metabolite transporter (DMT)-like permease
MAWIGLLIAFAGTMIVTLQRPSVPVTVVQPNVSADGVPVATAGPGAVDSGSEGKRAVHSTSAFVTADDASQRLAGNLLSLVAALAWAGGTVFSRPLLKSISPTQLSACSATIGLPFHLLLSWSVLPAALPMLAMVPMQLSLLYSGVLSTGLALAMWSFGVKVAGSAQAAVFQNLTPVFAISAAWLWRGEPVTGGQMIGGSMIIGGLILMRRSRVIVSDPGTLPAAAGSTPLNGNRSASETLAAPPTMVADTTLPGAAAASADA